jgi:HNH endonuclease
METIDPALIEALGAASAELGLTLEEAILEKAEELRHRAFFRLIPDSRLSDNHIRTFLQRVRGEPPTDDLVERVSVVRRGVRLDRDQIMRLEMTQNYRCAVCGTPLFRIVQPSVDHIQPLALGGKNTFENYQLLCRLCNSGKGKLPAWMVGVPYLSSRVSARVRYCVLARYGSKCQAQGCSESARTSTLDVRPRIPGSQGGRLVFDNLFVLCEKHARQREITARRRALDELRLSRRRRHARLPLAANLRSARATTTEGGSGGRRSTPRHPGS